MTGGNLLWGHVNDDYDDEEEEKQIIRNNDRLMMNNDDEEDKYDNPEKELIPNPN